MDVAQILFRLPKLAPPRVLAVIQRVMAVCHLPIGV
jgi:hypothetical protein